MYKFWGKVIADDGDDESPNRFLSIFNFPADTWNLRYLFYHGVPQENLQLKSLLNETQTNIAVLRY